MKFDLQTDKKAFCVKYQIDMSVYSKNRIFRLPFKYKNVDYKKDVGIKSKGMYSIFQEYTNDQLLTVTEYELSNYII